eukprot:gnl/MRDRNA2_/MRDRNA2_17054_c0_seq1.p1 gnl/MRDRNA2_/MRDRNA2_17054_c0~~gnl/MRDRNA2_/MRDRNA2_17054_c0_seq1.p1  ORF type:complete len:245 (+),score=55.43 gnl/MRDRNA2_/MRDRNA2_17054_c0_seq1:79-735(+)
MFPQEIQEAWNARYPDAQLTDLPFPEEYQLESTHFPMSKAMAHEYEVAGKNAGLQIGPHKERSRALTKVEEYAKESEEEFPDRVNLAKYVVDWLRARVFFANPVAMAVFWWYLWSKADNLRVICLKNKLVKPPNQDTSASLHLNVRFDVQGEEHTAEVQLVLESFLVPKDLEHKYYQLRRSHRLCEVLAPILEAPSKAQLEESHKEHSTTGVDMPLLE